MDHSPDRPVDGLPYPAPRAADVDATDVHAADVHGAAHDAARTADAAAASGTAEVAGRGAGGGAGLGGAETKGGNAAVGVAAGTVAGTMAGLQAGALAGAATLGVGGLAGAVLGAAAGAALAQEADPTRYTTDVDAHYRALYEGAPAEGAPAAGGAYDRVRPAYVFGHVAASEPELAGLTFEEAEPALRSAWNDELRARAGDWEQARRHVLDAYGHARAEGAGDRRTPGVVGSGGSAVDPVELDRAQRGLPSVAEGEPAADPGAPRV